MHCAHGSIVRCRASPPASCCAVARPRASIFPDGLLADIGHIAGQSSVGIDISAAALPASPALLQAFDAPERLTLQATGGDDYELAFTLSPAHENAVLRDLSKIGCGATRIGRVVEGAGVRLLDASGSEIAIGRRGWEHFA